MTNDELRRKSVIKDVIAIFIDVIGFLNDDEKKMVNENTHIIKDFNIDGDDATEVDMALEKYFSVKLSIEDWGQAVLIHEIADVIIKKMDEKP
ncbi:MAG: hypothetical protein L3J89_00600 [Gammaproteobacteria bacterium]|nr:hypothetical protein [Gammaproteobacteria bacterium]